jgi:putative lipoic acid-binding regulatory protein
MDSRLRIGSAIGKSEEEIAPELMKQVQMHAPDEGPPALSSDGKGAYPDAMLKTWGKVPEYGGRGAPPTLPKPEKDWECLQVIKKRKGGKLENVRIKVVYGDSEQVKEKLGCHTAYVERTSFLLTDHEWTAGPQNAFLLQRASFAHSCEHT